jgi:purine-nucleoside phosphorylase
MSLFERVDETVKYIRMLMGDIRPRFGIIVGTGLGDLSSCVEDKKVGRYECIPNFPVSTVDSHNGQLVYGKLSGHNVLIMDGRFHYYEGYSLDQVTFPVRVMKELGVEGLIVTNASGALNPTYQKGDIVVIDDHINLMGVNPLIGQNDDRLGVRFPDMVEAYNSHYSKMAMKIALKNGTRSHLGVYAAMTGPCLETRAEYRMLQRLGADCIGMSTVPEVIVAVHAGLKVLGLSVLTDMCIPDTVVPACLEDIVFIAKQASPKLRTIVCEFLESVR